MPECCIQQSLVLLLLVESEVQNQKRWKRLKVADPDGSNLKERNLFSL